MGSNRLDSNGKAPEKAGGLKDRRAHPRLHCKGEAAINILPDGPRIQGCLRELGAGGCRIDFESEIRLKTHSEVEVHLRLYGFALRLAGLVRRVDEETGAAIEFTAVSNRKAEQINYLLTELFEEKRQRWVRIKKMQEEKKDPG